VVQNENEFFSSVIGLGDGAHNLLQKTEIDGSCQTKVSVPVNTELYIIVPVRQKSRYNQLCKGTAYSSLDYLVWVSIT